MDKSVFTAEYGLLLRCLRELRVRQSVTQVDLAQRLGETQSWVSKCERGEHRLDMVELRTFCLAIGIELHELVSAWESAIREERSLTHSP